MVHHGPHLGPRPAQPALREEHLQTPSAPRGQDALLCLKPDRRAPRTFLPASSLVSETQTVGQRLARLDRLSSTTTD